MGFAEGFRASGFTENAVKSIRDRAKKNQEDSDKLSKMVAQDQAMENLKERILKSGGSSQGFDMFAEGFSEVKDPEVREKLLNSAISEASNSFKIKDNFQRSMAQESFKAQMSFIPETAKAMASTGNFSPEQIQEFSALAAKKAQDNIQQRISNFSQANQKASTGQGQSLGGSQPSNPGSEAESLFNQPLPKKQSVKQQEREEQMSKGQALISDAKQQFDVIADKHGVGRFKGLATKIRGGLGDLIPKGEQAPEIAAYEGMVDGLAVFIGRNVYEDDRVSEDDREAYKKGIAGLLNSEAEAKLMFGILDRFAQTGDIRLASAIKSITPRDGSGKGNKPSKVLNGLGINQGEFLSREDKIAILKKRASSGK